MKVIVCILMLLIALASCSKESLYRDQLQGNWAIIKLEVTERIDSNISQYTLQNAGTYNFAKSGDGSVNKSIDTSASTKNFKWSVISNHKVLLNFSASNTEEWTVLSNQAKQQIWENTSTDTLQKGGLSAIHSRYRKISLQKLN